MLRPRPSSTSYSLADPPPLAVLFILCEVPVLSPSPAQHATAADTQTSASMTGSCTAALGMAGTAATAGTTQTGHTVSAVGRTSTAGMGGQPASPAAATWQVGRAAGSTLAGAWLMPQPHLLL